MKVKRIVSNIETKKQTAVKRFYQGVLGLDILMDGQRPSAHYHNQASLFVPYFFEVGVPTGGWVRKRCIYFAASG